jgi:thioredoxin reductase
MNNLTSSREQPADVIVIGGGAAGLNGALMLARSRRNVIVIDGGKPRNAPAEGVHGLLGRDGMPPAELMRIGRDEVRRYGGEVRDGEVVEARRDGELFAVTLAGGSTMYARRLLVTTGLVDRLPDVAGLAERWGRDVVHCPYCHGWEVRDRVIAILNTGPTSMHHALLFHQLSDHVVFFENGLGLSVEHREELEALSIPVIEGKVAAV